MKISLKISLIAFLLLGYGTGVYGQSPARYQDSIRAVEMYRIAIDFARKGDPEIALEYFKQSLVYRKRVFGEKHQRLGGTYLGMAIQYKNLYQLDTAYKYFQIAENMYLFNAPKNDSRLGDIYSNIGNYFRAKGNLTEAIRYQERSVFIYENSPDKVPIENYYAAIYNLANAFHLANREKEALNLVLKYVDKVSVRQQVIYNNLIASIYTSIKQYNKAAQIHKKIIETLIKTEGPESYGIADQYSNYAQFFNIMFLHDSSIIYLKKAEKIYLKYNNNQADLGDLYGFFGDAFVSWKINSASYLNFKSQKTENLDSAILYYSKALAILNENDNKESTEINSYKHSNFPIITLRILRDLGNTSKQLANLIGDDSKDTKIHYLSEAIEYFKAGSDLMDYLRTGFVSDESKQQFTELQQDILIYTLQTSYDLYSLTKNLKWAEIGFQYSEKNKAVSLYDKLTETRARNFAAIPDTLQQLENTYSTRLAFYKEKLYGELRNQMPDTAVIDDLRTLIFSTEKKYNDLRHYFESNFSEYYHMKYDLEPISFKKLQNGLGRNEMILSYTLNSGYDELFVLAISKKKIEFLRQPFDSTDVKQLNTVFGIISDHDFLNSGREEFEAYSRDAFSIYSKLIAPFQGMTEGKKITVIPDGILCYLPFEALLSQRADSSRIHYNDLPYLILKNTINYAYSAELIQTRKKNSYIPGNKALAFSPTYPATMMIDQDSIHFSTLLGVKEEVDYLNKKINTLQFNAKTATEKNFRKYAGKYQILHLATHAMINDNQPMYSRLVFYPEQPDSLNNDGLLNTSDIYNFRLNARMAVLSACQTGSGILKKGDGIISLARGFFYAGCPSVVLTLWEVEDRTGTALMKEFYRQLKYGKSKDVALRNAKLRFLRSADPLTSHPHFWLGYIIVGNPGALFIGVERYFLIIMIAILIGLLIDLTKKTGLWKGRST